MKIKNRQQYSNDCGVRAIQNLLSLYNIKNDNAHINISKDGCSIKEMINCLNDYFYEVKAIDFNIFQLKNVKNFSPFIILLKKGELSHYVVVYKKNKRYLYFLDSAYKYSYKITYHKAAKYYDNKAIVVNASKYSTFSLNNNKHLLMLPILTLVESLFLLSTTVIYQQIIDNGFKDAILYFIIQILLLLITIIKVKSFLQTFKRLDKELINPTLLGIYNLNKEYAMSHYLNEVFYRIYDAYTLKSMILSLFYNFINDVILAILSFILLFFYSYQMGILVISSLIPVIMASLIIFKKTGKCVEEKRIHELEFFSVHKDYSNKEEEIYVKKDRQYANNAMSLAIKFQKSYFSLEKLENFKNIILFYYQSFMTSLIIVLYFTEFKDILSIGSLIAIINLVSIILQPTLSICSNIGQYSNYFMIKLRLKEIENNIDKSR